MTTLDGQAIKEIERLVLKGTEEFTVGSEQKGVYFIRNASGEAVRYRAEQDPHHQTAFDLATLKDLTLRANDEEHFDALYVNDTQIVGQSSDAHTRWLIRLALPTHPAFAQLLKWKSLTLITQKDLVRLLRTELSAYVDPTVIAKFQSLRVTSNSEGTSTVRPTSTALDSRIIRQVQADAGGDVPETIVFHVPVYDIPEARDDQYDITVYVEYDHDKQAFALLTIHNELRTAQESAVAELIDDLREHAAHRWPVHYGKPE